MFAVVIVDSHPRVLSLSSTSYSSFHGSCYRSRVSQCLNPKVKHDSLRGSCPSYSKRRERPPNRSDSHQQSGYSRCTDGPCRLGRHTRSGVLLTLRLYVGEVLNQIQVLLAQVSGARKLEKLGSHGAKDVGTPPRRTKDDLPAAAGWDNESRCLVIKGETVSVRTN